MKSSRVLQSILLSLCLCLVPSIAFADYVGQVQTKLYLAPESLALLVERAESGISPGFLEGDIVHFIIEFMGTDEGAPSIEAGGEAGYVTAYIPGGVEVVGADMIESDGGGGFVVVPPELPGLGWDGWGPTRRDNWDIEDQLVDQLADQGETSCWDDYDTAHGMPCNSPDGCIGNVGELHADTGIFYSSDPRTAVFTDNLGSMIISASNGYYINPTGDSTTRTHNAWDAHHTNIFGSSNGSVDGLSNPSSPYDPVADGFGVGPAGVASAVAGPDSGYPLDYTGCVGPWQRIQYPGSRIGSSVIEEATWKGCEPSDGDADCPGVFGTETDAGFVLTSKSPLPNTVNAVRFAIGEIEIGDVRQVRVSVRLTEEITDGLFVNSEVFGGDIEAPTDGKHTVWRYHFPSVAANDLNLTIIKRAMAVGPRQGDGCQAPYPGTLNNPNTSGSPNDFGSNYDPISGDSIPTTNICVLYAVTFMNTGNAPLEDINIYDTFPDAMEGELRDEAVWLFDPTGDFVRTNFTADNNDRTRIGFMTEDLAPAQGATLVYAIQIDADTDEQVENTASMCPGTQSNDSDCAVTNVRSLGTIGPVLEMTKTVTPTEGDPGSTAAYTITVRNIGQGDASNIDFVLRDFLPSNGFTGTANRFDYQPGSSSVGGGYTPTFDVTNEADSNAAGNIQTLTWDFGGSFDLDSGDSFTVSFNATVGNSMPPGPWTNTARLDWDGERSWAAATFTLTDECPDDPDKTEEGVCGCGVPDIDTDGDETLDCEDPCPLDPLNDVDQDGYCGTPICDGDACPTECDGEGAGTYYTLDTYPTCLDPCPIDALNDIDDDGECGPCTLDTCPEEPICEDEDVPGCIDECPQEAPNDTDNDDHCGDCTLATGCEPEITCEEQPELAACVDLCEDDPLKVVPGICGCGKVDEDSDGDEIMDCDDPCPLDPLNDVDQDGYCGTPICEGDDCPTECDGEGAGTYFTLGTYPVCLDPCPLDGLNDIDDDGECGPCTLDSCPDEPICEDEDVPGCIDECPQEAPNDTDGDDHCGDCTLASGCVPEPTCDEQPLLDSCIDLCEDDPLKTRPGICGCGEVDEDSDGDGTYDCHDWCPLDNLNDVDGDGYCDNTVCEDDDCPLTCDGEAPGAAEEVGSYPTCVDPCPLDGLNDIDDDDECGPCTLDFCPEEPICEDEDVPGCIDECPQEAPNDTDGDDHCGDCTLLSGCTPEPTCEEQPLNSACIDLCEDDPLKIRPGICGCGVVDEDSDGDGTYDCDDPCPLDNLNDIDGDGYCGTPICDGDACPTECDRDTPAGTVGEVDTYPTCVDPCPYDDLNDVDIDGFCGPCTVGVDCPTDPTCEDEPENEECIDSCPDDGAKNRPLVCGCHEVDEDSDGDGQMDCVDPCPYDNQNDFDDDGHCGLCTMDADCPEEPTCTDAPEDPECLDECPTDVGKLVPGVCGCPVVDYDSDGDETMDCLDVCPFDPDDDVDNDEVCGPESCPVETDCPGESACAGGVNTECTDNCSIENTDQADSDGDALGDVCDFCPDDATNGEGGPDADGDGVADSCDVCPYDPDNDSDGDGICGTEECLVPEDCPGNPTCEEGQTDDCVDNCSDDPNEDQEDADGDGIGDSCDECPYDPLNDADEDGVCGEEQCLDETDCPGYTACTDGNTEECTDNCDIENTDQADGDGDGIGDVCDVCPDDPDNDVESGDVDGDGLGDSCDICPYDPLNDVDGDGVCGEEQCIDELGCPGNPTCTEDELEDCVDNCTDTSNSDQVDSDGDGLGDICDPCPDSLDNDEDDDGFCGDPCEVDPDSCSESPCTGGETVDCRDNCPDAVNPDQEDIDEDGIGDECDICPFDPANDPDEDGVCDSICVGDECEEAPCTGGEFEDCEDNCSEDPNEDQLDSDADGVGDVCDMCPFDPDDDADEDGYCDAICQEEVDCGEGPCSGGETEECDDNCPDVSNPDQADRDDDGVGDVCDESEGCEDLIDFDCDGVPDDGDESGDPDDRPCLDRQTHSCDDNCVEDANPLQHDLDEDGEGDVCDDDTDNDGIPDEDDNCVFVPNTDQEDANDDGQGDACEGDEDGDGIPDDDDNCPITPNTEQEDLDDDGEGDVCDEDADGDGSRVTEDCDDLDDGTVEGQMYWPDPDGDGVGSDDGEVYCPGDPRSEGLATIDGDNCPNRSNSDQLDSDSNGLGDICEGGSYDVGGGGGCSSCTVAEPSGGHGVFFALFVLGAGVVYRRRKR